MPRFLEKRGFSLVEVTLAIAIVAFAFVSLLGLLPTGLNIFKQAMDTSVSAQIAQRVAGELQQTDYFTLLKNCTPNLTNFDDTDTEFGVLPSRYFDDQGTEIPVAQSGKPSDNDRQRILYEVLVRLSRAKAVPLSDGKAVSRMGTRNLTTLTIQVVNNPSQQEIKLTDELLIDPTLTRVSFQTFPAMIARNTVLPPT